MNPKSNRDSFLSTHGPRVGAVAATLALLAASAGAEEFLESPLAPFFAQTGSAADTKPAPAPTATASTPSKWGFNVIPYFWMPKIDAGVRVDDQCGNADISFNDIWDNLQLGGGILSVAQYEHWVTLVQFDLIQTKSYLDDVEGSIENTSTLLTAAFGYQFDGPFRNMTVDLMGGVRYVYLKSELTLYDVGDFDASTNVVDPTLLLRPNYHFNEKFSFDSVLAYGGGGDSQYNYELAPNFQYAVNETFALRAGYRKVYYDIDNSNSGFHGSIEGFLFGAGFSF